MALIVITNEIAPPGLSTTCVHCERSEHEGLREANVTLKCRLIYAAVSNLGQRMFSMEIAKLLEIFDFHHQNPLCLTATPRGYRAIDIMINL